MSDETDKAAALVILNDWAEPDVNPKLSPEEIEAILERNKRATTWAVDLVVVSGQFIAPSPPNGRWYRVKVPGVLASQPGWPSGQSSLTISDGSVIFEDAGEAQGSVYDFRAAAWEAWDKKTRKSSKYPTMSGVNVATIFDHCILMRDRFAPVLVA